MSEASDALIAELDVIAKVHPHFSEAILNATRHIAETAKTMDTINKLVDSGHDLVIYRVDSRVYIDVDNEPPLRGESLNEAVMRAKAYL